MPLTCPTLPTPPVPSEALSGLAFNQATRPAKSFAGISFFATISNGLLVISEMGSKSLVLERVDGTVGDVRLPIADDKGVAIRRSPRDAAHTDAPVRAGHVFNDHRLAERRAHAFGHNAAK